MSRQVLRTKYSNGRLHKECITIGKDESYWTEKLSSRKGFVRRIWIINNVADPDYFDYFPHDQLPVKYDWGLSQGPLPADVKRNKNCTPFNICSRCKTSSVYYRTAEFVSRYPVNGVNIHSIMENNGWKQHKTGHNSSTVMSMLRFVGAVRYDKSTKRWYPGPNSDRFLKVIRSRSN